MPRPTLTPPASLAPLLAASIAPGPAAGDHREAGLDQPAAELAPPGRSRVRRRGCGPSRRPRSPGPSSASAPKPSTNSAWIRSTRHGSVCTQSLGPRRVEQPLVGGARRRPGRGASAPGPLNFSVHLDCSRVGLPSQARSCCSQRSMCSTGTCSSCLWASIGSPGPKLTAGHAERGEPGDVGPAELRVDLAADRLDERLRRRDGPRPGSAPGAESVTVTSYPSKNSRTNATASASSRSGAKR